MLGVALGREENTSSLPAPDCRCLPYSVKYISCSLLILHAEDDPVVPFHLGKKVGMWLCLEEATGVARITPQGC